MCRAFSYQCKYLRQKFEIYAIVFAHVQMKKLYNIKNVIPDITKMEVNEFINSII